MNRTRLYLLSPAELITGGLGLEEFAGQLGAALAAGDVACFQLRLKEVDEAGIGDAVRRLAPPVRAAGVAFLLNDRADLAAELDCDGVHVGRDDMPCAEARRIVGDDRIVGVSCGASRHLAMEAGEAGADYVAFGSFFPSRTKPGGKPAATPELLGLWNETMVVPSVAIGGIDAGNCAPLVRAGADFLCVAHGVWGHPDGAAGGVAAMNRAIGEAMC